MISWTTVGVSVGVLGTILGLKTVTRADPRRAHRRHRCDLRQLELGPAVPRRGHARARCPAGCPPSGFPTSAGRTSPALMGTAVVDLRAHPGAERRHVARLRRQVQRPLRRERRPRRPGRREHRRRSVGHVRRQRQPDQDPDGRRRRRRAASSHRSPRGDRRRRPAVPDRVRSSTCRTRCCRRWCSSSASSSSTSPECARCCALRPDEFVVAALVALTVVSSASNRGSCSAIVASVIDHLRRSYRPSQRRARSPARAASGASVELRPGRRSLPGLGDLPLRRQLVLRQREPLLRADRAPSSRMPSPTAVAVRRRVVDARHRLQRRRDPPPAPRRARRARRQLVIAGASESVRRTANAYDLPELLGPDGVYDSVDDAVDAYRRLTTGAT